MNKFNSLPVVPTDNMDCQHFMCCRAAASTTLYGLRRGLGTAAGSMLGDVVRREDLAQRA